MRVKEYINRILLWYERMPQADTEKMCVLLITLVRVIIVLYILINPDRLGTWIGHLMLNIKLMIGEL